MPTDRKKGARREEVYWDAGPFINFIQENDPERLEVLKALVKKARERERIIVTSALVRAEVLYGPEGKESSATADEDLRYLRSFLENDWISVRATTNSIWETAFGVRREHGLKLPDAVHVATAIHHKIPIIETYDKKDLIKLDGRVGSPPLAIEWPKHSEADPPLFGGKPESGKKPK